MFRLRFPLERIPELAAGYSYDDGDATLLSEVRPAARRRGYLTTAEFRALCYWKTPRSQPRCRRNSAGLVRTITQATFSTGDEALKMNLLRLLDGVDWATASTILHFCDRRAFPILDYRALWSLGHARPPHYTMEFWLDYVRCVRELVHRSGHSMRIVDRALWQYSKVQQR